MPSAAVTNEQVAMSVSTVAHWCGTGVRQLSVVSQSGKQCPVPVTMALDYRKAIYRPNRPDTRLKTSYGAMSEWLRYGKGRHRSSMLQASLLPRRNCTDYTIRGSRRSSHQQHQTLGANGFLGADMQSAARAAALDENVPVHARYASGCGYDDFYNSFLAVKRHGPAEDFPVFGPPRLRHGRAGGSWRHVKEVLQAGGKRIVFVDGQISANDVLKLDHVPGGHLILPSHTGHSTSDDHVPLLDSFRSVILPPPSVPQANYRPVTVQKGLEKDNWAIIR